MTFPIRPILSGPLKAALPSVIAAILLIFSIGIQAAHADAKVTGVSAPQVSMMLEPYTPDGTMRLYTIPNGVSYWTSDLPIYQGDGVKLDVFVATGADELQHLKVRVDNVPVADLTKAPWTTMLSTTALGAGYHFVEAWVQVSGPKAQFATHSLTFFVSPPSSASTGMQPIAQVKGQEQILSGGQVVTVPLDPSTAPAVPTTPATPALLAGATSDPRAVVSIVLNDVATTAILNQAQTVQLAAPADASIVPAAHSTAQRFAYQLMRGDETIVNASQLYSAGTTEIRLQPRTATIPGLLPGAATLWVWGVDAQGNFGPPASATVQIQTPAGG